MAKPAANIARPPLVLIVWEDASELDTEAWVHETDHAYRPTEAIVHTVGFLLSECKAGVVISSAWFENDPIVGRREQIPRGMIRKITKLKP